MSAGNVHRWRVHFEPSDRCWFVPMDGGDEPGDGDIVIKADEITAYLDYAIRSWRDARRRAASRGDSAWEAVAEHYIDAFQSARKSILGELLD